jgi:hypothetical protein
MPAGEYLPPSAHRLFYSRSFYFPPDPRECSAPVQCVINPGRLRMEGGSPDPRPVVWLDLRPIGGIHLRAGRVARFPF